ncbi:MAG TPA: VOC family protein [Solirubrobacteraceae bacterium]|nr:VOC family protein [Solirubrobacteraceae bacterium]
MGERTEYTPGTFSWSDLSSPDQNASKAFYTALFGWSAVDMPVDEDTVYSMMQLDGKDVAAISPQPQQQRDMGMPPVWNSYVTVGSADAIVERVKELGGNAHAPAFDVMEAGRMAVLQDPQGAFFLVWEPRAHIGAGLVNAPGALVWNELQSPDLDGSASFYGDLFGWEVAQFEGMPERYLAIKNAGANNGGMREVMPGMPPNWLVYFGTEDIDTALAKVEELGGSKLIGPIDIQIAKLALVQDPQGAVFALYAGELEP